MTKQCRQRERELRQIAEALKAAAALIPCHSHESLRVEEKAGGDPVTNAEWAVNQLLYESLVQEGDGWLSEETKDDLTRLEKSRVWIVDPVDGTREYLSGMPEWCISVGLIESGKAVAGGIYNPPANQMFLGSLETGIAVNGTFRRPEQFSNEEMTVLSSRSEMKRGEWDRFKTAFRIQPIGSVAYKLALVAAGLADATWTLVPKNEWDVAAGVALVNAAHGAARTLQGNSVRFNCEDTLLNGLVALSKSARQRISSRQLQCDLPWIGACLR